MSQDYQYACERAELLGLPRPSEDEWAASEKQRREQEQDAHEEAVAEELEATGESTKKISGGLDELNTILSATQKKLNRFKNVCGSLGTLLKARVGSKPSTPEHKPKKSPSGHSQLEQDNSPEMQQTKADFTSLSPDQVLVPSAFGVEEQSQQSGAASNRKTDLGVKMGSHLDKLDSLISKAENAQMSMQHQNKQMRSFLK